MTRCCSTTSSPFSSLVGSLSGALGWAQPLAGMGGPGILRGWEAGETSLCGLPRGLGEVARVRTDGCHSLPWMKAFLPLPAAMADTLLAGSASGPSE